MRHPEEQLNAGHIPADLLAQLPAGTDPARVVIVRAAPRNYTGPILLALTVTGGLTLLVVMIAVTLHVAAAAAVAVLSATGSVGLTLKRPPHRSK
ncbi:MULTISPECIES: hypothetical protein [unclassified Streptomyces]|uniref:hypothetical protein n=1 Tax=unclassified Streptomyces TaxID=2593676 RepID=UPI00093EFD1D|nr:hypothetical protein [Streptomyces sp. CB02058]OKI96079.1 hypothetical protein AMK10_10565 [Streptomyces sp. CB02058]